MQILIPVLAAPMIGSGLLLDSERGENSLSVIVETTGDEVDFAFHDENAWFR